MTAYRFAGTIEADDAHQATHRLLEQLGDIASVSIRPTIREMAHNLVRGEPNCPYCGEGPGVHIIGQESPVRPLRAPLAHEQHPDRQ